MAEMTEVEGSLGVLAQTRVLDLAELDPLVGVQGNKLLASLLPGLLDVVEEVQLDSDPIQVPL